MLPIDNGDDGMATTVCDNGGGDFTTVCADMRGFFKYFNAKRSGWQSIGESINGGGCDSTIRSGLGYLCLLSMDCEYLPPLSGVYNWSRPSDRSVGISTGRWKCCDDAPAIGLDGGLSGVEAVAGWTTLLSSFSRYEIRKTI